MRKARSAARQALAIHGRPSPLFHERCATRRRAVPSGQMLLGLVSAIAGALFTQVAAAESAWAPSAVFVQAGTWGDTHQLSAGLDWDWNRYWSVAGGRLSGYSELSLSAWSYPTMDGRRQAWLGQLGLVPTFRYRPADGASLWFAELGIGATLMTTVYETQRKRF